MKHVVILMRIFGGAVSAPLANPLFRQFLRWLGKFHVLAVHFPIALLVAAAAAELYFLLRGNRGSSSVVRFCVLLGAAAATVGAGLGLLNAGLNGSGADLPTVLTLHRWTGTASALMALIVGIFIEQDARRGDRRQLSRLSLFLTAALVSVAGHLGGTLVFGPDYFKW